MRHAIDVPNFGPFADPRLVADLAREAEVAGWDGFFLWDHIGAAWAEPIADPWVMMAAMAMATERIVLGPLVTPLPRRQPQELARQSVTLDHLSGGRLILGVGIGGDWGREYSCFGDPADDRTHAAMLDEGLDVLVRFWSGETFSYTGAHYWISDARFLPRPAQSPRIPVWVAGFWPNKAPFRRAARWDGVCPGGRDRLLMPDDLQALVAYTREHRVDPAPFDVAFGLNERQVSVTAGLLSDYADAGVTWWLTCFDQDDTVAAVRRRIRQGPPSLV